MKALRQLLPALLVCGGCVAEIIEDGRDLENENDLGTTIQAVDATKQIFGTYGQNSYQNEWRPTLDYTATILDRFDSDLDDTDTKAFSWNTDGAKSRFEETGDATANAGADTVDLLFLAGHGGAWGAAGDGAGLTATHTMWNQDSRAMSTNMRLGDDSRGLSILSTYVCETHAGGTAPTDNPGQVTGTLHVHRWTKAFDGGLKMATGTVVNAMFGSSYANVGKRYSDNLQAGQLVVNAWSNALNIGSSNDPSVLATGSNSADCWARMDSITWRNVRSKAKLNDAKWKYMCRRYWENI